MKHKITKQDYCHECGEGCCTEWGTTWKVDGKEIYSGPDNDSAIIDILKHFGIQVELSLLDEQGEAIASLHSYEDLDQETE
jgi:hypothetical protein